MSKMKVRVQLTVEHLENSIEAGLEEGHPLKAKAEWGGSVVKMRYLYKNTKEHHTSAQPVQVDGVVRWNEEFEHVVELKRIKPEGYKSWFLYLKVQEVKNDSKPTFVATKAKIDITRDLTLGSTRTLRIPVECKTKGVPATVVLKVAMRITERKGELMRSKFSFKRATSSLLFACSGVDSCVPNIHNARTLRPRRSYSSNNREDSSRRARNLSISCSSSEGEPEMSYRDLRLCNFLISQLEHKEDTDDEEENIMMYGTRLSLSPDLSPKEMQEEQNQSPIRRMLSRVLSSNKNEQPKGVPLLNKSCSDIGGDDIDMQRHKELNPRSSKVHPEEALRISGFDDDEPFEVGNWERRSVLSRDGELELVTDVFLATIDQRSEKASGGSACTVLAVVIADWLHRNPGDLPLRCQLDQLVREGSLIWRDLCKDESHRERFSDQHFDLDTVLQENIRPLKEIVDYSYVGFLGMDELREGTEFLQGAMCFDCIWDKIMLDGTELECKQVYICSWNDHFFVVKIDKDAIYLIDTFGERLFEGCNQAYILKFHKDSVIYRYKTGTPTTQIDNKQSVEPSQVSKERNCNNTQQNGSPKKIDCEEIQLSEKENIENQQENNHDRIKNFLAKEATCNDTQSSDDATASSGMISSEEMKPTIDKFLLSSGMISSEEMKPTIDKETEKIQEDKKEPRRRETISEGMDSCQEYIKGFLASLPVRQLKMELRMGSIRDDTIHKRLQIELHYVAPRAVD